MKISKVIVSVFLLAFLIFISIIFDIKSWPGSGIVGAFFGALLTKTFKLLQDLFDTTNWKVSQRKLERGHFISKSTIIRISFAYLYRIKIGNKYLLVRNERGTEKYQPVGGVYKFNEDEKKVLKNRFHIQDDDKIQIDRLSRNDYRLRIENKYLRKFVKRFDHTQNRESIKNLSREFKEELIESGIVNWDQIKYRSCGRHITDLHYSDYFQIYEILLADIIELIPTEAQEADLEKLEKEDSPRYYFATAKEIIQYGINTETEKLKETIGDHTKKILQESEGQLIKTRDYGVEYSVKLH